MLQKLYEIESQLSDIFKDEVLLFTKIQSMYIDYHPPIVERIWFQHGDYRVYLHKIHKCNSSIDALFHPHPWESAIRIIMGTYETGIGHSDDDMMPAIDCKLILPQNSCYEMTEPNGWHYVNPVSDYVYSLMITGNRFERKMPVEPDKKFRTLTTVEILDIMTVFKMYYRKIK